MTRKNFPKSVKVACIKRATRYGTGETAGRVIYCEECNLPTRKFQIDHINPDGLTGQPTLENAKLLCEPCHAEKTRGDVAAIAKAKRREIADLGARIAASKPLQGPGFPMSPKAAARAERGPRIAATGLSNIARRFR